MSCLPAISATAAGDDPVASGQPAEADGAATGGGGAAVPHRAGHGLAGKKSANET